MKDSVPRDYEEECYLMKEGRNLKSFELVSVPRDYEEESLKGDNLIQKGSE